MRNICILALLLGAMSSAHAEVIFTKRSLYRNINVTKIDEMICLRFQTRTQLDVRQSCKNFNEPDYLVFDYARNVFTGLAFKPDPERVLVIGLGGGSIPEVFSTLFPEAQIDTVEIDPAVVDVATQFFEFTPTARMSVSVADGRVFVKRAATRGQTWDYIVLDAFNGDYIPEHLLTLEFLEECSTILNDGGVLVANTFSSSELYHSESVTYENAFDWIYNLRRDKGNRIIIAGDGVRPDLAEVIEVARGYGLAFAPHGIDLTSQTMMIGQPDWDADARVLTDQYNPANLMNTD